MNTLLKGKILFYFIFTLWAIYKACEEYLFPGGWGLFGAILASLFSAPYLLVIGGIGLWITLRNLPKESKYYFPNLLLDLFMVTVVPFVISVSIIGFLLCQIPSVAEFVKLNATQQQADDSNTYDAQQAKYAKTDYEYFSTYFKTPRHIKYVIGEHLFLDDGVEIRLSGVNENNETGVQREKTQEYLKQKYLGKTLQFILPSVDIFYREYNTDFRGTWAENPDAQHILDTISAKAPDGHILGRVPEVQIEGEDSTLPPSVLSK